MSRSDSPPFGGGTVGLLLAVLFRARGDYQRCQDPGAREAIEGCILHKPLSGLLQLAGIDVDLGQWRRFLSAETVEDAVPGFVTAGTAARLLGLARSEVGRYTSTVSIGRSSLACAEGVELAAERRRVTSAQPPTSARS